MTAKSILATSGIYAITNAVNGKKYIGSAVKFGKRWGLHLHALRCGNHHSQKLQRSWDKHGESAFSFSIVENVPDRHSLIEREQFWIDAENSASQSGYNISPTAGSCMGVVPSKEKREKIRTALMGRKRPEVAAKMIGYKHSPESLGKMSAMNLGRKQSQEQIDARVASIAVAFEARKLAGLRHQNKGRKRPQDVIDRQKITIAATLAAKKLAGIEHPNTGKKQSPELIAKRVAAVAANRALRLAQAA